MELTYSKEEGIYGTVASDDGTVRIQFLFSDIDGVDSDGIKIVEGGNSSFDFFVFVPVAIYHTLTGIQKQFLCAPRLTNQEISKQYRR